MSRSKLFLEARLKRWVPVLGCICICSLPRSKIALKCPGLNCFWTCRSLHWSGSEEMTHSSTHFTSTNVIESEGGGAISFEQLLLVSAWQRWCHAILQVRCIRGVDCVFIRNIHDINTHFSASRKNHHFAHPKIPRKRISAYIRGNVQLRFRMVRCRIRNVAFAFTLCISSSHYVCVCLGHPQKSLLHTFSAINRPVVHYTVRESGARLPGARAI